MTKAEFKAWLQGLIDTTDADGEIGYDGIENNCGEVWRKIEEKLLLASIGVPCAWDYRGHDMIFKCSDGLLASGYETGIEDETIWFFDELDVENNMRDYTLDELMAASARAQEGIAELTVLAADPV